jgi:rSAM/selenodomain-associated transferase 1
MTASSAERCVIGIFAKAPHPGLAKTRLIPSLGEDGAAALHARLVERTVATAQAARAGEVQLWCSPDEQHSFFQSLSLRSGCLLLRQCEGDLGRRMAGAVDRMLCDASFAIIVGTDCPALTPDDLRLARDSLAGGCDAVLGPSEDGGYYLIGLCRPRPRIFDSIDWGSDRVLEQTAARLRSLRLRWRELALHWDVDRPQDVDRLRRDPTLHTLLTGGLSAAPSA